MPGSRVCGNTGFFISKKEGVFSMKNKGTFMAIVAIFGIISMAALCNNNNGTTSTSTTKTKTKIEMVSVPGGSFEMGNPDTSIAYSDSERPVHTVTLDGFKMGKYPVTQEQYRAVMEKDPNYFHGGPGREAAAGEVQEKRPVEQVSWYDAIVFCNKLSMAEGLTPAYRINGSTNPADWGDVPTGNNSTWNAVAIVNATGYRLPTEAQWEYAAKGGKGAPGNYTYAGSNDIDAVAWYDGNSGEKTHEVGKKKANGLGLYDMSGNVWEWCWDWYGGYPSGPQTDPYGAVSGAGRVIRGGGWYDSAEYVRSAFRNIIDPYFGDCYIGFRLMRP
jgi:formylglycine-generating enzyme required for sulfatase activity